MSVLNIFEFGTGTLPSSFVAEEHGECIDFIFKNELGPSNSGYVWTFKDHIVYFMGGPGEQADYFTVKSPVGWDYLTEKSLLVAEGARGVITVCQALLG